jgi:hypothetical protein
MDRGDWIGGNISVIDRGRGIWNGRGPDGSKPAEISGCRFIALCNSRVFIAVEIQHFSFQILPPLLCSTGASLTGAFVSP